MAVTTYGSISQRTAAWAAADMLSHAEPILVLERFGQSKPIPANKSEAVKFRRPVPFAPAITPLTEGVTPVAKAMVYEDVHVQLQQYGDYVEITDKVQDLAEDPVLKDATMLCGEQAAETCELLLWGVLRGGTNVFFQNGSARNAVNTPISLNKLRAVTRMLHRMRAKPVTKALSASPNYKTEAVAAAYICFAHTDCEADLRNLPSFTPVEQYGQSMKAFPHEVGKVENIRFILSPVLLPFVDAGGAKGAMRSTSGTAADVYPMVIVGADSYGLVPLKGKNAIEPKVLQPGQPRGGDPLGQRGSVGWKTWWAGARLNEAWMARLEVAVTEL